MLALLYSEIDAVPEAQRVSVGASIGGVVCICLVPPGLLVRYSNMYQLGFSFFQYLGLVSFGSCGRWYSLFCSHSTSFGDFLFRLFFFVFFQEGGFSFSPPENIMDRQSSVDYTSFFFFSFFPFRSYQFGWRLCLCLFGFFFSARHWGRGTRPIRHGTGRDSRVGTSGGAEEWKRRKECKRGAGVEVIRLR